MKSLSTLSTLCLVCTAFGTYTRDVDWFDAAIASYDEAAWTTATNVAVTAGAWAFAPQGVGSGVYVTKAAETAAMEIALAAGDAVSFAPSATPPGTPGVDAVTSALDFSAYPLGQMPVLAEAPKAALVLVETDAAGTAFALKGYTQTGWTTLHADGLALRAEMHGTLRVERRVRAGLAEVRYFLDGQALTDDSGAAWLPSAVQTDARFARVEYRGRCTVQTLAGACADAARAIVLEKADGAFAYYAHTARAEALAAQEANADSQLFYLDDFFRVTPYLQRPATNAMSILWFTETNAPASVTWWPLAGGAARTLHTAPELATELAYAAQDRTDYATAVAAGKTGIARGPLQTLPWQHRVRLTELAPGTAYGYRVELDGGTCYTNAFHTAPARDTPVRFICYSDCETEPESTGTFETSDIPANSIGGKRTSNKYPVDSTTGYATNIVRMMERAPDFYVIAGDLVQYGSEQRDWDEFWRHNAGVRNDPAGRAPILAAPGNHDYGDKAINSDNRADYDGGEAAIRRYLRYFECETNDVSVSSYEDARDRSELFHRLDWGRATLIFMDANNGDDADATRDTSTVLYRDAAAVPAEYAPTAGQGPCRAPDFNPGTPQFAWITNQLADAQAKGQFIFVVCHPCPWSVGYHNRPNKWRANSYSSGDYEPYSARATRILAPYFIKYGVTAWIAGHDEIMEHSRVWGVEERPDGTRRRRCLEIYDVGNSGDGLRGGGEADKPYSGEVNSNEVFRAHVDAPEIFEDGVWTDGGKHYGHLEVNIATNRYGVWECTLTPKYVFTSSASGPFALRAFHDAVTRRDPAFNPRNNLLILR